MRDKKHVLIFKYIFIKYEISFLNLLFLYFSDDESKETVYTVNKDLQPWNFSLKCR